MDSQPADRSAATNSAMTNKIGAEDAKSMYMRNRRTLEFLFLAGFLGIGGPVAVLMGVSAGEKTAAVVYPHTETVAAGPVAIDYKALVMGTPGDEEKGHSLFQTSCVVCHGPNADGQGAAAAGLKPPPRNFMDPKAKWSHGRELTDIYNTISKGSPGTAMAGFSVTLSIQDRWALVHYIASLPGVKGKYLPVDEAVAAAWRPEKTP